MQPSTTKPSPASGSDPCPPGSTSGHNRERRLIDACIDPLIVLTAEGRITDVNKAAVWVMGVPREQLLGGDFADYVVEPERLRSLCREVLSKGRETGCVLGIRHHLGQVTETICNVCAHPDEHAGVAEIFLSARDVTGQRRVEEALRRSERTFNEAQCVAHIGYWDRDVDADKAVWSAETYRIFGLRPQEGGVTWHEMAALIHPDDRARTMFAIQRTLQGGPRYDVEFRVVRPDGEERIIHSQANLTKDSEGKAVHMFGTAQDVTERKQAEEKLRQANARISEILESITDLFAVFDREWRYIYVNDRSVNNRGLPREQMLGRCVWDIYPELVGTPAEKKLRQAMTERVTVDYEIFLPSQKRWLGVHAYPSRDGISTYSRDITERKWAEAKLSNSEARYRALYRDNPVMLFTLDAQGVVLAVNPTGVSQLGYPLEELEGQSVLKVFHPDDREEVARQFQTCLSHPGQVQHWQFRKIRKDGVMLWVDELAQPVRDLNGAVNVLVVCQDVTERKRAEEEIRTLNTTLDRRVRDRTRELAESEKRFHNIYDTAPVSIWQEDWTEVISALDGLRAGGVTDFAAYFREHPEFVGRALDAVKIQDVNQWTLDMFAARTKEQLLASLGTVFATPDTLPGFVGELVALAQGQLAYRTEMDLNTVAGATIRCFLAMAFPPPGSGSGNVLVSVLDITERKRTEEALRRSEESFRLLFETTLQGVVFQNADGRIVSMNPSAVRILGKTPEEIVGLTSVDLEHDTLREDGSPFPGAEHPAMAALSTGREVRGVIMGVYNPREHAYHWIDIQAVPLFRAGAKKPHQVYTLFDDVTEQRRNERQIRKQTALLTGINRIFRETLSQVTDDEAAALFLQVIRELTASPIGFVDEAAAAGARMRITLDSSLQVHGDQGRAEMLALMKTPEIVALREAPAAGRTQIVNRPGTEGADTRTIRRFLGVPLLEDGKVIGLVGLAGKPRDYTDGDRRAVEAIAPAFVEVLKRKRSELAVRELNDQLAGRAIALERANKEMESFSYSVSHDLRAPLRTLDGFSRALLEDYEARLDEEGKDYLQRIRKASQRMGHLIDDLLHLAQVSRSELHRVPVDLSALARTVADGLRTAEPERKIEFVIEPGLTASGDARLLQIVMENLFGNACKFSRSRPVARIEFGRTTRDGRPAYFVRDDGVGFDMTYAHKLFGAFQRLHSSAEFPGTGIGLATVQRIIHRHGGSVAAESQPGQGATFYFTLSDPTSPSP